MEHVVDFNKARTSPQAKVFAGRERGKYWRKEFRLDELDHLDQPVRVIIPADILSLNISFFLNLFGSSIRFLGRHGFLAHYKFECDPALIPFIEQGVDQALKRSSALPEA